MAVGAQPTKSEIDNVVGQQTRNLNILFDQIEQMKAWLDTKGDSDLAAFYTDPADIATLRSAYADLAELAAVYKGAAALAAAKDFRVFPQRTWGLGF